MFSVSPLARVVSRILARSSGRVTYQHVSGSPRLFAYLSDLAEISLDLSSLVNPLVPRPGFIFICKEDSLLIVYINSFL